MVSCSDWVWSAGLLPATVAITRTAVATEPELPTVLPSPSASLEAVQGIKVMPPTAVLKLKLTVAPDKALPAPSTTRNLPVEVSCRPAPPVPFREMVFGVAESNCIDPAEAGNTTRLALALKVAPPKVNEAVIVSVLAQPLSR